MSLNLYLPILSSRPHWSRRCCARMGQWATEGLQLSRLR